MQTVRAALVCAALVSLAACSQREVRTFSGYAEGEYVKVAAPLSGNLARVEVRRGETVEAGETLFSLDGLGLLSFESVVRRDYPVVLGSLYLFTLIGLVVKLVSDLLYVAVDPRVQFGAVGK